jgi:hypothetical protein
MVPHNTYNATFARALTQAPANASVLPYFKEGKV